MRADGDNSFETLALPHLDTVYRVALRLARNEHEAEDLAQETYLKAYKAFGRFEMREHGIRPWLLRILHNTFLNRVSRSKRAPRATDQQSLDQVHSEVLDRAQTLEPPMLDYENLDSEVKEALGRLSPDFRLVLSLWATMDFSYKQIAEILDVPIGTVMSRLHRARQQLVSELRDYARENRLGPDEDEGDAA